MTNGIERAVAAGLKVFQHLRYASNIIDEIIVRRTLSAALPLMGVEREDVARAICNGERCLADPEHIGTCQSCEAGAIRVLALCFPLPVAEREWQPIETARNKLRDIVFFVARTRPSEDGSMEAYTEQLKNMILRSANEALEALPAPPLLAEQGERS